LFEPDSIAVVVAIATVFVDVDAVVETVVDVAKLGVVAGVVDVVVGPTAAGVDVVDNGDVVKLCDDTTSDDDDDDIVFVAAGVVANAAVVVVVVVVAGELVLPVDASTVDTVVAPVLSTLVPLLDVAPVVEESSVDAVAALDEVRVALVSMEVVGPAVCVVVPSVPVVAVAVGVVLGTLDVVGAAVLLVLLAVVVVALVLVVLNDRQS